MLRKSSSFAATSSTNNNQPQQQMQQFTQRQGFVTARGISNDNSQKLLFKTNKNPPLAPQNEASNLIINQDGSKGRMKSSRAVYTNNNRQNLHSGGQPALQPSSRLGSSNNQNTERNSQMSRRRAQQKLSASLDCTIRHQATSVNNNVGGGIPPALPNAAQAIGNQWKRHGAVAPKPEVVGGQNSGNLQSRRSSRNNQADVNMRSTDSRTSRLRSVDHQTTGGAAGRIQTRQQAQEERESQIKLGTTRLSDYSKLGILGKGTYGEVHKCVHNASGQIVAMKTYFFENVSNGINYSTMRELSILRQLQHCPQFVRLLDILEESSPGQLNNPSQNSKNIHCIFEFCDKVLSSELNKREGPLSLAKQKHLMKDLLTAMDILHSKMIMHRDIKPDNILIDKRGNLKLADFGLAKKASFLQRKKSNAIVSLWYRAPEIILGSEQYFLGVDMWSVGCIFAELMGKKPLFMCREDREVLAKVFMLLGTPSPTHCAFYKDLPRYKQFIWPEVKNPKLKLRYQEMGASPEAIDLLEKLLCLDPSKRIMAKEALNHPWFNS